MATKKQINDFIDLLGPIIARYAAANGYKYPSAIIAQAIHESGVTSVLSTKYYNYFGMKCGSKWTGPSVKMGTKEYISGNYVNCSANWRCYSSPEEGIKGYFDFIKMTRYTNLKRADSPSSYLNMIVSDGWCTSPASIYVPKCLKYINDYDLTRFDNVRYSPDNLGAYIITCSALRIRKDPTIAAPVLGKLDNGSIIKPIEKRAMTDGSIWYRTYDGWMCGRLGTIDYLKKL